MKATTQDKRDALRYRFLRSAASRDHKGYSKRALDVQICDWAKNFNGSSNSGFWSSLSVAGKDLDMAIDKAMRRHGKL